MKPYLRLAALTAVVATFVFVAQGTRAPDGVSLGQPAGTIASANRFPS